MDAVAPTMRTVTCHHRGEMQPVHCGQTAGFVGRAARSGETIVSALPAPA